MRCRCEREELLTSGVLYGRNEPQVADSSIIGWKSAPRFRKSAAGSVTAHCKGGGAVFLLVLFSLFCSHTI